MGADHVRVGVMMDERGGLSRVRSFVAEAAAAGFDTVWLPQLMDVDALTAIAVCGAVAGAADRRVELGTAVVASHPRHPVVLAQQALTAQAACGGRLTLGIGVSHRFVVEGMLGMSFDRPAVHMREYLECLIPLLQGEEVDVHGEVLSARARVDVADAAPPPPVLLAAMAPRMLHLAGARAAGTITWMTGPRTLEEHIVPRITEAAEAAGRPPPRVVAGLPVCVTADPDAARDQIARQFALYGRVPSYRAMLDREGAVGPAGVAIVGNERTVAQAIRRLGDIGVTDFMAAETGSPEARARTRALLRTVEGCRAQEGHSPPQFADVEPAS